MLAGTSLDALIEQAGGVLVAVIGAGATLWGIQLSRRRQKEPNVVALTADALLEENASLERRLIEMEAERDAWRNIAMEYGLDRRHHVQDSDP